MKLFYCVALLSFTNICFANPYNIDKVLAPNIWGWLNESNKIRLPQLMKSCNAKVVVELGSWLGAFTIFIADHLDDSSKVYAVDIWEETPECTSAMGLKPAEAQKFYQILYQQFLSNMIHQKLTHKIIPIRMRTVEAAEKVDINPDLVYVDASHAEEDVYNDVKSWYPKIVSGGIMCGDDWGWPSVRRGVTRIAEELNQTIHAEGNIWWFNPKE